MATSIPKEQRSPVEPKIVAAERLNDGVVIKFSNGQCGFFSDAYLFSKLSDSETLNEAFVEW